jgi:hypothetical protein
MSESLSEGMSRRGLDFLRQIVMRKEHELTDEQEAKMKREIREDPNLFDPTVEHAGYLVGTSIYIPAWLDKYLKIRKMITGKPKAQQIREIVEEYIASEILELLEEGTT